MPEIQGNVIRRAMMYVAVWLGLVSVPVNADFQLAVNAYQQQDYETAFQEFKRLSELGDAPSQRNLAVMYFKGEHVERDVVEAYAWASLAAEQESDENFIVMQTITEQLPDKLRYEAKERFERLSSKFGLQALNDRLMPIAKEQKADCSIEVLGDAVPVKTVAPSYPAYAQQEGLEGFACFTFYLSKEGSPQSISLRDANAYEADNPRRKRAKTTFVRNSLEVIEQWQFMPLANELLREHLRTYCLDYTFGGYSAKKIREVKRNQDVVAKDNQNAEAMNTLANHYSEIGKHLESIEDGLAQQFTESAVKLKLRSAIFGSPQAQYEIASDLLTGNRCEKDEKKGIIWLTFSAQQGHPPSQYLLGNYLMNGIWVEKQPEKALQWYRVAAESGYKPARLAYLRHVTEQGMVDVLDLETLLPSVINENDMLEMEAAAAVAARKGEFAQAVKWQTKVVEIASKMSFTLEYRQQRLAEYQLADHASN